MKAGGVGLALVFVLPILSTCGCASKPIEPETQRVLRAARALWEKNGPSCYEITEEQPNIFSIVGIVTMTVCEGRMVAVRDDAGTPRAKLESQITSDWTVEGLFAGLERDASADPLEHYYRVEFDALMGFPRKINNGLRNAYDAEWMVEVLQVVRLDCAGCRDNGSGRPTGRESPAGR